MTHPEKRARREAMARAVREGESPAEVAQRYRVGYATVREAMREHGVVIDDRRAAVKKITTYTIIARLIRGVRPAQIARDCGVSRQRVGQIYQKCVEAGILNDRNGSK